MTFPPKTGPDQLIVWSSGNGDSHGQEAPQPFKPSHVVSLAVEPVAQASGRTSTPRVNFGASSHHPIPQGQSL